MRISVIMSTYNGEKYLISQMDSIRTQTVIVDEVLIFDDVSEDNTVQTILNYIEKYNLNNWKLFINEKNLGWKKNFAQGISKATGDIIFTADQDDIWIEDKIEVMSKAIINDKNIQLLIADYVPFQFNDIPDNLKRKSGVVKKMILKNNWKYIQRPGCVFCFTKDIQKLFIQCWKDNYAHDLLLWQIAALQDSLYRVDYNAILFRRHDRNSTPQNSRNLTNRLNLSKQSVNELAHLAKCFSQNDIIMLNKINEAMAFEKLRISFFERNFSMVIAIKLLLKSSNYLRPIAWWIDVLCKIKE